jgi:hypothetical protein
MHGTPYQAGPGSGDNVPSISGTPVLYIDTSGAMNALFGLFGQHEGLTNLYIYSEGNLSSIATGATQIIALTPVTNGVMYVAGSQPNSTFTVTPQVFGIKVDQNLFQSLRDFVIESQMMQDPDENAPGGDSKDPTDPVPPSRARYQTHLTIVDDQKAPQPNEPIKIWADAPTTLLIDGQSFEVGPGDAQYAAVKTGVDGSLVIMRSLMAATRPTCMPRPCGYGPASWIPTNASWFIPIMSSTAASRRRTPVAVMTILTRSISSRPGAMPDATAPSPCPCSRRMSSMPGSRKNARTPSAR